ncbi:hypothetical protein IFM89_037906 [Coptis chinensis]|uniref:IST1-like protein n=1 Tax=Coptis chinensis TaxID=261450 RepID=A0A835IJU2_9MAGN|nr:hypothetical protein IFM89_037906 [Coptis chinensis]
MLDGLLGRGFSAKCKSLIKLTNTRIDAIKRKRNAMQKYLKKDIADLLANGLDINAYGRADGLSVELNLSSCYDFVERCCDSIPKQLSVMQKQKDCPEESREAVSSLMFAAARFADLPELRDLRDIFTERYGKNLEVYANMEFVENLASKPPIMEKKLQLMREIAQEFSIKWDSNAFEQKIANSPLPAQDQTKRQASFNDPKIDGNKVYNSRDEVGLKRDNRDVLPQGRRGLSDDGYVLQGKREENGFDGHNQNVPSHGRRGLSDDGYRLPIGGEQKGFKKDDENISSGRRLGSTDDRYKLSKGSELKRGNDDACTQQEYPDDGLKPRNGRVDTKWKNEDPNVLARHECTINDGFKLQKSRGDTISKTEKQETSYRGRRKHDNGHGLDNAGEVTVHQVDKQDIATYNEHDYLSTKQKVKMDGKDEKPFAGDSNNTADSRANLTEKPSKGAESMKPLPPPPYLKPNGGKYTSGNAPPDLNKALPDLPANSVSERIQIGPDPVEYDDRRVVGSATVKYNDNLDHQDDFVGEKKPKPKSVRRRTKLPPGEDYKGNNEGDESVKRYPSGRRREDMRRGLQHALVEDRDSKDEEERMMDKLLVHYSKKPSQFEPVKVRGGLNAPPGHHDVVDAGEPQKHRRKKLNPESVPPPSRAVSLPPEPVIATESERVPARATSFQPEMFNPGAHVHPKLPDYDDLAARFASLRGKCKLPTNLYLPST